MITTYRVRIYDESVNQLIYKTDVETVGGKKSALEMARHKFLLEKGKVLHEEYCLIITKL